MLRGASTEGKPFFDRQSGALGKIMLQSAQQFSID